MIAAEPSLRAPSPVCARTPHLLPGRCLYCRPSIAESRPGHRTGAEEPQGPCRSQGRIGRTTVRSASLSARARQLTPQAMEREGTWHAAELAPGLGLADESR